MCRLTQLSYILSIFLFVSLTFQHECGHDKMDHDIKVSDPAYTLYSSHEGRLLLSYNNLTLLVDTSTLTGVGSDFSDYVANSIMPAVINIVGAALQVPVRNRNLTAGGYTSLCGGDVPVPSYYNTEGVDADLVLFVKAVNNPSASYVASASACLLDSKTLRPIIGRMTYNTARIYATDNDNYREQHLITTLHELTHVLGFSSALYSYYINPQTGAMRTGHVSTITSNGYSTTVLNIEPLTTRIRNHFNCSSAKGAYLENQGGSGSAGSHFERRIFYNDYMTASAIIDTRISEFTLALLEGTGWYQVNYAMGESMTWGKNKGCSFIDGACVNNVTFAPNFDEFCPSLLSVGCSWTKRAGSSCGSFSMLTQANLPSAINWWNNNTISQDQFSDNCPTRLPFTNLDCEDPDLQSSSMISGEYFGYGSKCFMSTLYPRGRLSSSYPYCFKSTCQLNSQGKYYVQIKVGSQTATCTSAGSISVSGYNGVLICPDPASFCNQIMTEGFCRRGCSARGQCVDQTCVCEDGWEGFDCSKPAFMTGCNRCSNSDDASINTCYGDVCTCDPSNSTCSAYSLAYVASQSGFSKTSSAETSTLVIQSTKNVSLLIPILASCLGATALIVLVIGIWYLRKKKLSRKTSNISAPQEMPVALKANMEQYISGIVNQSQRSEDRPSLHTSYNNSPMLSKESPVKTRLYVPSAFSNHAPRGSRTAEPQEIQIIPVNVDVKDPGMEDIDVDVQVNSNTAVQQVNSEQDVSSPAKKE